MALFVRQDDSRSELQQRLAAELREKALKKSQQEGDQRPDGVEDSNYLKNTKTTTSLAWVWVLIVVLALGAMVFLAIKATSV